MSKIGKKKKPEWNIIEKQKDVWYEKKISHGLIKERGFKYQRWETCSFELEKK